MVAVYPRLLDEDLSWIATIAVEPPVDRVEPEGAALAEA